MKRREFMTFVGGTIGWPLTARAELSKVPTIGFLGVTTPSAWSNWVSVFEQRLHELGWIEGRTVQIDYRWTDGRQDRLPEIAAAFAQMKVDIIVTAGPPAVKAARQAMPTTPVVFALVGDPVGTGLVASLARPGGNVTGMSMLLPDTSGKRIEILRDLLPDLRTLAVMANVNFADALLHLQQVQQLGTGIGLEIIKLELRRAEDIGSAFDSLQGRAQALYVCSDPLVLTQSIRINTLAIGARLPTMHGLREYVEMGGLLSYGPNVPDMFRRTAEIVHKILSGAKPADVPVEQPTNFDLVINLTTAKALKLTLPESFLLRATEVID